MTKKNSKVATPIFEVASENDKNSLINNVDNFDIIKISENPANNANGVKFGDFSDSVVRTLREAIKDGLILNKATELFKCDTSPTKLMKIGKGYGSAIMSDGKITGHATFELAGGDMAKIISPFLALQVASVALGQYFMLQINEKLGQILDIVKEISMKFEYEKMAKLETIWDEIKEISQHKSLDKSTIDKLERLKEKARDVFNYYKKKIKDVDKKSIDFGSNQRFKSRIDGLRHSIGDFELDVKMYKHSKEILVCIYTLLYIAYMQSGDFDRAETMFNALKQNDKVFDDEMSKKLDGLVGKILEQFEYIQENKDWIPNATLKPFDTLVDKSPLPKKAKSFMKNPIDTFVDRQDWMPDLAKKAVKNIVPKFGGGLNEEIHKMATNDKDENTAKPHIERFSILQEAIKKNDSKVIQDNAKFIQQIEQKRTIYYTKIDGDSYALIEKIDKQ